LLPIDAFEHGRNEQELESAAHREALIGAITGAFARGGVQHGNAEAAGVVFFEVLESYRQAAETDRRGAEKARQRKNGNAGKASSAEEHLVY
jgi:hypothetical protein